MGLEVKTTDDVTRTGAIEGIGSSTYIQEGFRLEQGSVFGPVTTPDATIVAKVLTKSPADMAKLGEERSKIRDEIKSTKGRDRGMLFEAGLKESLVRQGKIKIHQEVINRLIQQYRGA
jgi:hypothetical protein